MDGISATRVIKADLPDVRVVMLTMSESDQDLFEAIRNGACGYLLKTDDTERFFELLLGLMRGESPLSPGLAGRVLQAFTLQPGEAGKPGAKEEEHPLTSRQIEVLTLVAQGLTYKEVGAKLFLAEQTIKYHMGEIVQRLHAENRRQAIALARHKGLVV
jgi:two-component system NarL family response regulator